MEDKFDDFYDKVVLSQNQLLLSKLNLLKKKLKVKLCPCSWQSFLFRLWNTLDKLSSTLSHLVLTFLTISFPRWLYWNWILFSTFSKLKKDVKERSDEVVKKLFKKRSWKTEKKERRKEEVKESPLFPFRSFFLPFSFLFLHFSFFFHYFFLPFSKLDKVLLF